MNLSKLPFILVFLITFATTLRAMDYDLELDHLRQPIHQFALNLSDGEIPKETLYGKAAPNLEKLTFKIKKSVFMEEAEKYKQHMTQEVIAKLTSYPLVLLKNIKDKALNEECR